MWQADLLHAADWPDSTPRSRFRARPGRAAPLLPPRRDTSRATLRGRAARRQKDTRAIRRRPRPRQIHCSSRRVYSPAMGAHRETRVAQLVDGKLALSVAVDTRASAAGTSIEPPSPRLRQPRIPPPSTSGCSQLQMRRFLTVDGVGSLSNAPFHEAPCSTSGNVEAKEVRS
jgi:hypothetical protein